MQWHTACGVPGAAWPIIQRRHCLKSSTPKVNTNSIDGFSFEINISRSCSPQAAGDPCPHCVRQEETHEGDWPESRSFMFFVTRGFTTTYDNWQCRGPAGMPTLFILFAVQCIVMPRARHSCFNWNKQRKKLFWSKMRFAWMIYFSNRRHSCCRDSRAPTFSSNIAFLGTQWHSLWSLSRSWRKEIILSSRPSLKPVECVEHFFHQGRTITTDPNLWTSLWYILHGTSKLQIWGLVYWLILPKTGSVEKVKTCIFVFRNHFWGFDLTREPPCHTLRFGFPCNWHISPHVAD